MTPPLLHDWMRPRLEAMFRGAAELGFDRETCVAVLIDLASGSRLDEAKPSPDTSTPRGPWPGRDDEGDLAASGDITAHIPNLVGNITGRP